MADRFLLKQFAGNAANNGIFGSAQQGQGVVTSDIKQVQSLNAFEQGWESATMTGDKLPTLEEFQGVEALLCKSIKEMYSEGIPQWLATEKYYKESFCIYNGKIFKNITGAYTTNNPELDTTNWEEYSAGKGDNKTSISNENKEIEVIGVYNKNTAEGATEVKYDWIGTKQQWLDQNIATQHPEWIWLITDDYNEESFKCDGQTINKNSNDELQAIGVKDNKNNSTHKLVVCTLAQYKAWKEAGQIDEDTDYDITDDVIPTESVEYPHIIDRHVDGVRGYTIWSDGYCEQWGYENAGAELREVSLMKTYRDTNYNIQLTIGFEGGTNVSLTISENSSYQKTGSKFYVYGHTALKCSWTTKGFLAEGQY